jgi:hypothetical protein
MTCPTQLPARRVACGGRVGGVRFLGSLGVGSSE